MAELNHANHTGITFTKVGSELRAEVTATGTGDVVGPVSSVTGNLVSFGDTTGDLLADSGVAPADFLQAGDALAEVEAVAGGAGFVNVSGAVALDLSTGRAFHQKMVGNITGLSFTNIPDQNSRSAAWTWVLWIDATGGYSLGGTPTVRWVDGRSFDDADLTADAVNVFTFWRIGTITYGALVTNGTLRLDGHRLSFADNGTQLVVTEQDETVELGSVTNVEADGTAGTGTLTFGKNGPASGGTLVSGSTALVAGDVLTVTMTDSTTASAVNIPRVIT